MTVVSKIEFCSKLYWLEIPLVCLSVCVLFCTI